MPEETRLIAEENLTWGSEEVQKHILTSDNGVSPFQEQMGSLIFDPNLPSNEVEDQATFEADDKQAELI